MEQCQKCSRVHRPNTSQNLTIPQRIQAAQDLHFTPNRCFFHYFFVCVDCERNVSLQIGLNVCFGPSEGTYPYNVWQVGGFNGIITVNQYGYASPGCTGTGSYVSTISFSSIPATTCSNYFYLAYRTNSITTGTTNSSYYVVK